MARPIQTLNGRSRPSLSPFFLLALLAAASTFLPSRAVASAVPSIDAAIASPQGQAYSGIWGVVTALGLDAALANTTEYTLFLPSNAALGVANTTLDTTLALLPTQEAQAAFLTKLLQYHAVNEFKDSETIKAGEITNLTTLLQQPLYASNGTLYSDACKCGKSWNATTQVDLTPAGQTSIALYGIDTVLFPIADLASLFDLSIINSTCFEEEPVTPPVNITANVTAELNLVYSSYLFTLSTFNTTAGIINATGVLPALVQLAIDNPGVTVLAPDNSAWERPWVQLTVALSANAIGPWKNETLNAFLINVLKFHVILAFKTSQDWISTDTGSSFETALFPPLYFAPEQAAGYWYVNATDPSVNVTNIQYPDLQSFGDQLVSIQGIEGVLVPLNKSRLVPPSARAIACPPGSAPSPTPAPSPTSAPGAPSTGGGPSTPSPSPPPPPPKPAGTLRVAEVFIGSILTLVVAFLIQAMV